MSIFQGSEAKLIQGAINEFEAQIKEGTYKLWPFEKFKDYPTHTQHRTLKLYSTFNLLSPKTIQKYREDLGLVGYRDAGE